MAAPDLSLAIGIDLGTSNSAVAICRNGEARMIADENGDELLPSYVTFCETDVIVGRLAKRQANFHNETTIYSSKRLIGRFFHDPSVQADMLHWPFKVIDDNNRPKIKIDHKSKTDIYAPEQIGAMILAKLKETAEKVLGETITKTVITVPAYFNNSQRQATKDAGRIAGLDVIHIISEPTAAAIAYGLTRSLPSKLNILVYDLGAGTFDVTILAVGDNIFDILSTTGDTHLGGDDFDTLLVEHCLAELETKRQINIRDDKKTLRKLRTNCEEAKHALSAAESVNVELPIEGQEPVEITRAQFEQLSLDLFKRTQKHVLRALRDAKLSKDEIHEVLLVGGCTRIPKVAAMLRSHFKQSIIKQSISPDHAVALGAAFQAALLNGAQAGNLHGARIVDVTPFHIGTGLADGTMAVIIQKHEKLPISRTKGFETSEDNQQAVLFDVLQGDSTTNFRQNFALGSFVIDNIPPGPKGEARFDVTFSMDENGILVARGVHRQTGKQSSVTITNCSHLEPEEIQAMAVHTVAIGENNETEKQRLKARCEYEKDLLTARTELRSMTRAEKEQLAQLEAFIGSELNWIADDTGHLKQDFLQRRNDFHQFRQQALDHLKSVAIHILRSG